MVKRICISVGDEDYEFLEIMQLSPSGLFKQKIEQVKQDSANYNNKIKVLENATKILQEKLNEYDELLTKNGIIH